MSYEMRIFKKVYDRIKKAKAKFPDFASSHFHAMSLLVEEVGEASQELNDAFLYPKRKVFLKRAQDELLDVIAVAVRTYEMLEAQEKNQ